MGNSISVAMATCNGEKYINEQLDSIMHQLKPKDELVIRDDVSTDATGSILLERMIGYLGSTRLGPSRNFERIVIACSGDIIVLCDQDDIWFPSRLNYIREAFNDNPDVSMAVFDGIMVKEDGRTVISNSIFDYLLSGPGILRLMLANNAPGCCMAFRKELKKVILPFPEEIPHDLWINFMAQLTGKVLFVPIKTILYRRHENTATGTGIKSRSRIYGLLWILFSWQRMRERYYLLKHAISRIREVRNNAKANR